MNKKENVENGNRQYMKLENAGEYEGILFKNTKSRFQPAYNLVVNNSLVYNIRGYMAKQIKEIEPEVVNHKVYMKIEKKHSNKYNKDFLKIIGLKVFENAIQTKLQVEHIIE